MINTNKLLCETIDHYGTPAQLGMVKEELAELIAATNRWQRGRILHTALAEEIADVKIMLMQLEIIAAIPGVLVKELIEMKLERLESRIKDVK